jgi:hypothetical protein
VHWPSSEAAVPDVALVQWALKGMYQSIKASETLRGGNMWWHDFEATM